MRDSRLLAKRFRVTNENKSNDLVNIVGNWFKNYHAKKYDSEQDASVARNSAQDRAKRLDINNIPEDAKNAIETAIYITGSDIKSKSGERQNPNILENNLYYVGQMESEYRTKTQIGGGPAKSYWQVEPETAKDILENASGFFGDKFEEKFSETYGTNAKQKLDNMSMEQLSEALEKDDSLAATFAAMKINQTYN
tara:strand:+ start:105 stop:689 length:585 start_codon:yes stop_codon:yes gene_type:complete